MVFINERVKRREEGERGTQRCRTRKKIRKYDIINGYSVKINNSVAIPSESSTALPDGEKKCANTILLQYCTNTDIVL